MTSRYEYSYLETGYIRLLHILSVTPQVRVQVEVAHLDADPASHDAPVYAALSYLWGDDRPFGRVIIEPSGCYVDITRNLAICFAHLDAFVGTKIWIDALCINQHSDEEKSRQVARMASVYERAAKVLLWLGPSADGSDAAMEGIARYGGAALRAGLLSLEKEALMGWPDVGDDPACVCTRDAVLALMVTASEVEGDDKRAVERFPRLAFAALTHREYFNRVWVKQEITLARKAVALCGHSQVDAESFHAATLFYGMLNVWETSEWRAGRQVRLPGPFSMEEVMAAPGGPWSLMKKLADHPAVGAFFAARRKFQRTGGRLPLYELLHTSYVRSGGTGLRCGNPRDKIYGLLGMANDVEVLGICIDYSKTPDEAYEQVARALISKGHVDIFKWCRSRHVQPPTWVPNFREEITYTWSEDMGVPLFKATGSRTQPTLGETGDDNRNPSTHISSIRLRGIRLDSITAIGTIFMHNDQTRYDQMAARKMFHELKAFLERPSIYPETNWVDAAWRIPICDKEYHPTSMTFRRATAELSGRQFVLLLTQDLEDEKVMAETMSYQGTMRYKDGARPICSEKGYVGLGPAETALGDVIVLLFGATTPLVFRPVDSDMGVYHLVGETYVYGVMDGEMMGKGIDEDVFELW